MSLNSAAPARTAAFWPMIGAELRIGLRANAFRALALVAFLVGLAVGGAPGRGVSFSAYAAAEAAWQYIGLLATAWMSLAAVRETSLRTAALIYSKPQSNERLVLLRFIGAIVPLFGFVVAVFVGAAVARLVTGQALSGFWVYGTQLIRAFGPILFIGGAAFCLALLFESAIVGSLAGLTWIVLLAGRNFLPKVVFPAYTQTALYFALFGIGLVLLAALLHRRARRGKSSAPAWLGLGTFLLLVLPLGALWSVALTSHDPIIRLKPHFLRMAGQHVKLGWRAPGFTLPDQDGRFRSLSEFDGRIIVLGIVSPDTLESANVLDRLESIQQAYRERGVQVVVVCISQDEGVAALIGRGEGVGYPVLADIATYHGPAGLEQSPVAEAYEAVFLPKVVITDRRRRVRITLTDHDVREGPELEDAIKERLEAEPE